MVFTMKCHECLSGAVCKLYFDLEYDVGANPGTNGDTMVETLIKVCS